MTALPIEVLLNDVRRDNTRVALRGSTLTLGALRERVAHGAAC